MKDTKQLVPPNSGNEFRKTLAEIAQVFGKIDLLLAETFLERVTRSQQLRRDEALYPLLVEMCNSLNNSEYFVFFAPVAPVAVVLVFVPKHFEAGYVAELSEAVSEIVKAGGATVFVAEHHVEKWRKSNIRALVPPANLRRVFRVLRKRVPGLGKAPCWTTQTTILGLRHLDQAVADPMWSVSEYGNTPKNLRSIEYTRGIRALDEASAGSLGIRLAVLLLLLLTTYLLVPLLANYGYKDAGLISFFRDHPISGIVLFVASLAGTIITSFLLSAYVHALLYQEIGTKVLIKKLQAIAEIKIAHTAESLSKLANIADLAFGHLLAKQGAGAGFFGTLIIATIPGIVTTIITGRVGPPQLSLSLSPVLTSYIPLFIVVIYIFGVLVAFYLANKASRAVRALALHRIRLETFSRALAASSDYHVTASGEGLAGKEPIAAM